MAVLAHIRAKTRCAAVQDDEADQPAFYQRIEAVVNRGHGNVGHGFFGPDEDLLRRGMVALLQQHIINMLALGRKPEPARRQALIQFAIQFSLLDRTHLTGTLDRFPGPVNT